MDIDNYLKEFLQFQDELKSFLFRMVSNQADCEDIVQETYIRTVRNIQSFRGESSFKTWVFSIALNLARNHLKSQARWDVDYTDIAREMHEQNPELVAQAATVFFTSPDTNFRMEEHLDYCFTCITKTLDLSQQVCLLLKEVYGFKQHEIESITGLSEGKVKHAIVDARRHMMRIFNNRCALINKSGMCDQCTALKGRLNPEQDAQAIASEMKIVKAAQSEDAERLFKIRLDMVRGIDPINKASNNIHKHFLENIPKWVEMAKSQIS
ncbi:MAG: RNA polymerase sigma factor [Gammaproteobacteria bacterium]|nr:RNA polymerase sigma factor [Gammaproteobacteria bacterium]